MQKGKVLSFVEQATGIIDEGIGKVDSQLGKIPTVGIGKLAGQALDFLRANRVPIIGCDISITATLSAENSDKKISPVEIKILETASQKENTRRLNAAIDEFERTHGILPKQVINHKVSFRYDESQITD